MKCSLIFVVQYCNIQYLEEKLKRSVCADTEDKNGIIDHHIIVENKICTWLLLGHIGVKCGLAFVVWKTKQKLI